MIEIATWIFSLNHRIFNKARSEFWRAVKGLPPNTSEYYDVPKIEVHININTEKPPDNSKNIVIKISKTIEVVNKTSTTVPSTTVESTTATNTATESDFSTESTESTGSTMKSTTNEISTGSSTRISTVTDSVFTTESTTFYSSSSNPPHYLPPKIYLPPYE